MQPEAANLQYVNMEVKRYLYKYCMEVVKAWE